MAMWTAVLVSCISLQCFVWGAPSRDLKQTVNNRPILGILSQELSPFLNEQYPYNYSSYIAASYVKFLESAGARVVPIRLQLPTLAEKERFFVVLIPFAGRFSQQLVVWYILTSLHAAIIHTSAEGEFIYMFMTLPRCSATCRINQTRSYYENIINSVNGVLFPGGGARFNEKYGYGEAGTILYQLAVEKNLQGDYFPIWGTCLGFELLTFIAAQQKYILTNCSAENVALPLEFKEDYLSSRLYGEAHDIIITSLKTRNSTANFHKYCVTERSLKKYGLDAYWNVLSLNHDMNGLQFVSSFEHRQYPFYGVQFHPEKNVFEWYLKSHNPHFTEAILVSQYFGNFLVNEARRSGHHFATSEEEKEALIYNYTPVYTGDKVGFEQLYFFTN